jgi:hypothetical protein
VLTLRNSLVMLYIPTLPTLHVMKDHHARQKSG